MHKLMIEFQKFQFSMPYLFSVLKFKEKDTKTKVAYILFYVTKVEQLRHSMQAHIICDRINSILNFHVIDKERLSPDKIGYPKMVKIEDVEDALSDRGYFSENDGINDGVDKHYKETEAKKSFTIAETKVSELTEVFCKAYEKLETRKWRKDTYFRFVFPTIAILIAVFLVLRADYVACKQHIDWPTYKERTCFNQSSAELQAVYFLYFVTEILQFRADMKPEDICGRLVDNNIKDKTGRENDVNVNSVKQFLDKSELVSQSHLRDGAFVVSREGREFIESKVHIIEGGKQQSAFSHLASLFFDNTGYCLTIVSAIFYLGMISKETIRKLLESKN